MRRIAFQSFIVLVLLCLSQAVRYYPLLPERVASHFGASGMPDAWSSKESFMKVYLIVIAVIAVLFPGMGFILRITPASLVNLPNKDYWFAPERRNATIEYLSTRFLWFGCATLLLLFDIFRQSFMVQLGKAQGLTHPVVSLVAYVGFAVFWSIAMIRKFSRRP